jgi:hypothetical protein
VERFEFEEVQPTKIRKEASDGVRMNGMAGFRARRGTIFELTCNSHESDGRRRKEN